MTLRVAFNYAVCALCIVMGLVMTHINLKHGGASIVNYAIVALMFYGAYYFYRQADKLSA